MPAYYSPLTHETLLQVQGPDAATFLQGQATCDVREVDAGRARPAAWCTPQGRMLADFLLVSLGPERFGLRLGAEIAAGTAERLGKYIVFSKASIEPLADWRVFACWGESAGAALQALAGDLPRERHGAVGGEGFCLVQVDGAGEQFEFYLDTSARRDLVEALAAELEEASPARWRTLRIEAGAARVEATTVDTFLPQALDFDLAGHVNFRKGCYTGQEVVARLHYRGTPKRRLYRAEATTDTPPAAGEVVCTGDGGKSVGNVVNAEAGPGGTVVMLVSLAVKSAGADLRLGDADGPPLAALAPVHGEAATGE